MNQIKLTISNLENHAQLHDNSCIPMSIETILKLENIIDAKSFPYQNDFNKHGRNEWITSITPASLGRKIIFKKQYSDFASERSRDKAEKTVDAFFETIEEEITKGRYVIISLFSGFDKYGNKLYHMYIIYGISNGNYDYFTFRKYGNFKDFPNSDLKQIYLDMEGTDIITYEVEVTLPRTFKGYSGVARS